jgi:hypothetical protein
MNILDEYKILGEELQVNYDTNSNIKLKDISSSEIISTIKSFKSMEIKYDINFHNWIYIFEDVLLQRRKNKILKIKNRILCQ